MGPGFIGSGELPNFWGLVRLYKKEALLKERPDKYAMVYANVVMFVTSLIICSTLFFYETKHFNIKPMIILAFVATISMDIALLISRALRFIFVTVYKSDGTMVIDKTRDDKDIYRLEIDSLDNMDRKSKIVLRIKTIEEQSQWQ